MQVCKICEKVKFDFLFFEKEFCFPFGCVKTPTDICKECAKSIQYEAVIKEDDKIKK